MSKELKVCEDEASGRSIAQGSWLGSPGPLPLHGFELHGWWLRPSTAKPKLTGQPAPGRTYPLPPRATEGMRALESDRLGSSPV